jgi:iron-sulfur cluster assembly protein
VHSRTLLRVFKVEEKAWAFESALKKAGCSGFEYFFEYVDDILTEAKDIIFNESECNIYVDQESLNYLKGSMVDYSDDGLNKGIMFHNPNAKAVCGCGESFTI